MLNALARWFAQQPSVLLALVFGSAARGTLKPGSDVEIALMARHPLSHAEKRALIKQITLSTGVTRLLQTRRVA